MGRPASFRDTLSTREHRKCRPVRKKFEVIAGERGLYPSSPRPLRFFAALCVFALKNKVGNAPSLDCEGTYFRVAAFFVLRFFREAVFLPTVFFALALPVRLVAVPSIADS